MTEFILYITGIILLMADFFFVYSGIMALVGIAAILTGLYITLGDIISILYVASGVLLFFCVMGVFLARHITQSRIWKKMVLKNDLNGWNDIDYNSLNYKSYIGKKGISLSVLRPSGKVRVEDTVLDAISEGDYIDKGSTIVVYKSETNYVVVKKISP